MADKVLLGISACLLGHQVRYNGGHQHDRFLTDTLGKYVEYIPVCPEVESGFGVPRESMRLVGDQHEYRLITSRSSLDRTEQMLQWLPTNMTQLAEKPLDGFIVKSKSPSCGLERVKVYPSGQGIPKNSGVGLFATELTRRFPLLPVEDDGRLHDHKLRENFIERIFVHRRWRHLLETEGKSIAGLVRFHTRHKLLILSHSEKIYRQMGRLVAHPQELIRDELFASYELLLMSALKLLSTPNKHTNVLHHLLGYFKNQLTADEKQEMLDIIDNFKAGTLPLIVPITLLQHYIRKYGEEYLAEQYYLTPHPLELQLRNHA